MWLRTWYTLVTDVLGIGSAYPREPEKPAIPFGCSTHDYVGGSTLLKKRTLREIQERSGRVDATP